MATAYASSDVLVFPSATETFGNVTLEAMASGLACLVADAAGSADLVAHGRTGLRFDPTSAADLAHHLHELVLNDALRAQLARRALAFAQTQGWTAILHQQQAIYTDVIARYAPSRPQLATAARALRAPAVPTPAGWAPPIGAALGGKQVV